MNIFHIYSLLPLFYYKGIETFQKLLTAIVKVENNFEKISKQEAIFENYPKKIKRKRKKINRYNKIEE